MSGRRGPGRTPRRRSGAAAGLAVGLAVGLVVGLVAGPDAGAPAAAAPATGTCAAGVEVVIDFGALGGEVERGCGPAGRAADTVAAAGFSLADHPRQAGFVCRVEGLPADGDCLRTDAYWGLFVAEDGGAWRYASAGLYGQPTAAGDAVALVWQDSARRRTPGSAGSAGTVTEGGDAAASVEPAARDADREDAEAASAGGLPTGLVLGVLVAVFGAAGVVFWRRRPRAPRP